MADKVEAGVPSANSTRLKAFRNSCPLAVFLTEGFLAKSKTKAVTTLPGRVEKVIRPHPQSGEPEKAQISLEGADQLYKEIRVPNRLTDDKGEMVKLKPGAEVDVTIEADPIKHTVAATEKGS
jgi:hypothetical protein